MRIGSLDMGTNALLLTIVEWDGESMVPLHEDVSLVRLGQDLQEGGNLHPEARIRTLNALENYFGRITSYCANKVIAVATDALRRASDGDEFLQEIQDKFGLSFRIISSDEEAALTFKATRKEFSHLKKPLLMFDIGGGSTEIVVGNGESASLLTSLPLGTVSLTARFVKHDPIPGSELASADGHVRRVLQEAVVGDFADVGIGVAGTITTLKAMTLEMEDYDHTRIHKSILTRDEVNDLVHQLTLMTTAERINLKGLPERRADIIPMGALITQVIMDVFRLSQIYVSDRGLRWGVLYDWIERQKGIRG